MGGLRERANQLQDQIGTGQRLTRSSDDPVAAARLRMAVDSKPEALDELDRRIMQLKIEREALKVEKDEASRDRLARLDQGPPPAPMTGRTPPVIPARRRARHTGRARPKPGPCSGGAFAVPD